MAGILFGVRAHIFQHFVLKFAFQGELVIDCELCSDQSLAPTTKKRYL